MSKAPLNKLLEAPMPEPLGVVPQNARVDARRIDPRSAQALGSIAQKAIHAA
jgi:hypothetical protein